MTRQQLRKQHRDAVKNLAKAKKTIEYKAMTEYFAKLPKEDYLLLKDGKHTDPKAQKTYARFTADMKDFIALEARVEYCESLLPKNKIISSGE